ncbi:MAG: response regulator [Proteobacteria bacterium]|nr:response regulator [Pseudomonadota bacterium]
MPNGGNPRILILAPIGRDAPAMTALLHRIGLEADICSELPDLVSQLDAAAVAVVAEEALFGKDASALTQWVACQPAWSDLPFIILTSRQEQAHVLPWRQRLASSLRNVTLIERPVQSITLTSAVQAAVRARLRQYEVKGLLEAQHAAALELEALVAERTQALAQMNEELRREMAERSRVEQVLRQTQKMDAVGQLSGGIAHDFNNLLQGLIGSLDLIRRKPDDSQRVRRWADSALQAADRGARLTAQLLAFSRAQQVEAKPVDVSQLVHELRDLLNRTLGPMIDIRFDLNAHAVPVLSDATQMEMAVLNLAINARDAMPQGGSLVVATKLRRVEDELDLLPGDYVELSVTDSGTGMPAEVAACAFDPFFTTKEVGKGTGLGLSQVYGIARQAGGTAQLESRPGEGTTVRMLLRATEATTDATAAPVAPDPDETAHSATVLVVDDDPSVRSYLSEALDSLGYRVVEAPNGSAALDTLEQTKPDAMLVDFAMPGLNGAEVAKAAQTKLPRLPIIFASGYADTAAIADAACATARVLRKPFRMDELQRVVAAALRKSADHQGP